MDVLLKVYAWMSFGISNYYCSTGYETVHTSKPFGLQNSLFGDENAECDRKKKIVSVQGLLYPITERSFKILGDLAAELGVLCKRNCRPYRSTKPMSQ